VDPSVGIYAVVGTVVVEVEIVGLAVGDSLKGGWDGTIDGILAAGGSDVTLPRPSSDSVASALLLPHLPDPQTPAVTTPETTTTTITIAPATVSEVRTGNMLGDLGSVGDDIS
jgi:hypothetical protein